MRDDRSRARTCRRLARCCATSLLVPCASSFATRGVSSRSFGVVRPTSVLRSSSSATADPYDEVCDVLVLGSGPAGRSIASLLSAGRSKNNELRVTLADANYDRSWAPNYGVWEDEWEALVQAYAERGVPGLETCVDVKWDKTDCYFGGSFDVPMEQRTRIDRAYQRVDRHRLRDLLSPGDGDGDGDGEAGPKYNVVRANHVSKATDTLNIFSPTDTFVHDDEGSTVALRAKDGRTVRVRARLVVDATGHESSLTLRDDRAKINPPGFQIAYGLLAEIDETDVSNKDMVGPYDKSAMTLFDYRDDHVPSEDQRDAFENPTFMYVMPLGDNRVFFEETSLVARPAMSFRTCKKRCEQRLRHLGITVAAVEEEEFCYIPMGGPLPRRGQRVLSLSTIVHPSTGYNLCRVLAAAAAVDDVLSAALTSDDDDDAVVATPGAAAAAAYDAVWSPENVRQRDFAVYGGEFLMGRDLEGLRGFFDGFFRLPLESWAGFLAGWPGLPYHDRHATWFARVVFGVRFLVNLPPSVALAMVASIATSFLDDGGALVRSVTPLLGAPDPYGPTSSTTLSAADQEDAAAKREAVAMIRESRVTDDAPVAFAAEEREPPQPQETSALG